MGQLQGDFTSLKNCSLVCSSWHFMSRPYLYRTLIICPKNRSQIHQQLLSSGLLSLLKRFVVRDIHALHENIYPPHPGATLLNKFASILTEFHLYNVTFDSFVDLACVVSALQLLRVLIFDGVAWTKTLPWDKSFAQACSFPPLVVDLQFRSCIVNPFSIWLVSQPQLVHLSRLEMALTTDLDVISAGDCLYHLGPHIIHLHITFPPRSDVSSPAQAPRECISRSGFHSNGDLQSVFGFNPCISFSTLRRLRQVHIHNFIDSSFAYQSAAEVMAPILLVSIPVPSMRGFVFYLQLRRAGELDIFSIKWDFFDEALTGDIYSNVESVEFVVAGRANVDGVASLLAMRLPRVAEKGILRVRGECE
ncbi:hypothetical protein CPB83DRAFT_649439 [Crepidotus variabilis]|uniref:F-box domain-containing protein n=1 Tax=Crepidotus variabilis TaxID=179855 RepID=A0A9P6JKN8_9AGAR|nr:hypothetical protein CPB83DRAFT_649439 [Crepidotus variabilis]